MSPPRSAAPENTPTHAPEPRRSWSIVLLWITPALLLVLILAYGVLTRPPRTDTAPHVGQPLADFTLPDLHGNKVQLAALRGKVVFINVWTTWCPPCIEEMPTMQRLYEQLHPRGLEILAVSLDALGAQVVEPFLAKRTLTFPILLDTKSQIERLYKTGGVPESFIVDKAGNLVEKVVGPRDWTHPEVLAYFERLLAAPTATTAPRG